MNDAISTLNHVSGYLQEILGKRGISSEAIAWMEREEMPQPYRGLLAHEKDMTSTLENFHKTEIDLEVLEVTRHGSDYVREVLLKARTNGAAIEYGAIDIVVDRFPQEEKEAILRGDTPLGTILTGMDAPFFSRPKGFFSIPAPEICKERFGSEGEVTLFGRFNQIYNEKEEVLASIIEILPAIES